MTEPQWKTWKEGDLLGKWGAGTLLVTFASKRWVGLGNAPKVARKALYKAGWRHSGLSGRDARLSMAASPARHDIATLALRGDYDLTAEERRAILRIVDPEGILVPKEQRP
jgi:hypothetical protein